MFIVKLAPASQADALRLRINEAIKQSLPFAFPEHKFEFVEERDVAEQFTVLPSFGETSDALFDVQAAVDRIATTLNPPIRWS